jgi:4-hydroxy-3-methylbut-2-enyl diphosphate reductase
MPSTVTVRDPEKVVWLSQTTLSVDETMETVASCASASQLHDPPSDDICYATQNRQLAVKQMARDTDLMIVVGLAQLVQLGAAGRGRAGARCTGRAPGRLRRRDRPGLAGGCRHGRGDVGASVPEILVRDVLAFLAEHGYADVQPVVAAEESLLFALPNELRRDLKARTGIDAASVRRDSSSYAELAALSPSALSLRRD